MAMDRRSAWSGKPLVSIRNSWTRPGGAGHVAPRGRGLRQRRRGSEPALAVNPVSLPALTVLAASRLLRGDTAGYESGAARCSSRIPRTPISTPRWPRSRPGTGSIAKPQDTPRAGSRSIPPARASSRVLGMNELRHGPDERGPRCTSSERSRSTRTACGSRTRSTCSMRARTIARWSPAVRVRGGAERSGPAGAVPDRAGGERLRHARGALRLPAHRRRCGSRSIAVTRISRCAPSAWPGSGALGVSFGPVVAMDAPSARQRGEFNFGSTLWHELAHTFTLGVTDHRIPRWFSEGPVGLRGAPGPDRLGRRDSSLSFLAAFKQDKLLPVSRLTDGFVRPTYPEQIIHAYYQASLVCEMVVATRGWQAIRGDARRLPRRGHHRRRVPKVARRISRTSSTRSSTRGSGSGSRGSSTRSAAVKRTARSSAR